MMRDRVFTPPFLLLFALLNLLIAADLDSRVMALIAGGATVVSVGLLARQALKHRRAVRLRLATPPSVPPWRRAFSYLLATGIVLAAVCAEWIVLRVATDTWVEPAPGLVHGEIRVHGPDYGKGISWNPDLCRPATNPGVVAAALMQQDEPFPLAWIIARPGAGVAAIDVQRSADASTVRFYPADCTRLHGDVQPLRQATGPAGLAGYADAECARGSNEVTVHVDFNACLSAPSAPVPGSASGHTSVP